MLLHRVLTIEFVLVCEAASRGRLAWNSTTGWHDAQSLCSLTEDSSYLVVISLIQILEQQSGAPSWCQQPTWPTLVSKQTFLNIGLTSSSPNSPPHHSSHRSASSPYPNPLLPLPSPPSNRHRTSPSISSLRLSLPLSRPPAPPQQDTLPAHWRRGVCICGRGWRDRQFAWRSHVIPLESKWQRGRMTMLQVRVGPHSREC